MSYLDIELARTLDEDRYREAERCQRISKASVVRPKHRAQVLIHRLRSFVQQERRVAAEPEARILAELS